MRLNYVIYREIYNGVDDGQKDIETATKMGMYFFKIRSFLTTDLPFNHSRRIWVSSLGIPQTTNGTSDSLAEIVSDNGLAIGQLTIPRGRSILRGTPPVTVISNASERTVFKWKWTKSVYSVTAREGRKAEIICALCAFTIAPTAFCLQFISDAQFSRTSIIP